MTDPVETERPPARRRPQPDQGHAASGARILVGGLAAGAGLAMVGAMAAAAQASESEATLMTQDAVRRVVVVAVVTVLWMTVYRILTQRKLRSPGRSRPLTPAGQPVPGRAEHSPTLVET